MGIFVLSLIYMLIKYVQKILMNSLSNKLNSEIKLIKFKSCTEAKCIISNKYTIKHDNNHTINYERGEIYIVIVSSRP